MLGAFRSWPAKKAMGLMALTGRRPVEIFFSAKFSLPRKNGLRCSRYVRSKGQIRSRLLSGSEVYALTAGSKATRLYRLRTSRAPKVATDRFASYQDFSDDP